MLTEIVEPSSNISPVPPAEGREAKTAAARRAAMHGEVPVLGRDTQANQTNWVTTGFMVAFHLLAVAALFMFTWKAFFCFPVLWYASKYGHRHGISPSADTSRLPDAEVGGVLHVRWRDAVARGWADFLGGYPSRSPSALRTMPAIRTPPMRVAGGRTSVGSSPAISLHPRPRMLARYAPDLARDVPGVAEQISLGSHDRRRLGAAGVRRMALPHVGHFLRVTLGCIPRGW